MKVLINSPVSGTYADAVEKALAVSKKLNSEVILVDTSDLEISVKPESTVDEVVTQWHDREKVVRELKMLLMVGLPRENQESLIDSAIDAVAQTGLGVSLFHGDKHAWVYPWTSREFLVLKLKK